MRRSSVWRRGPLTTVSGPTIKITGLGRKACATVHAPSTTTLNFRRGINSLPTNRRPCSKCISALYFHCQNAMNCCTNTLLSLPYPISQSSPKYYQIDANTTGVTTTIRVSCVVIPPLLQLAPMTTSTWHGSFTLEVEEDATPTRVPFSLLPHRAPLPSTTSRPQSSNAS